MLVFFEDLSGSYRGTSVVFCGSFHGLPCESAVFYGEGNGFPFETARPRQVPRLWPRHVPRFCPQIVGERKVMLPKVCGFRVRGWHCYKTDGSFRHGYGSYAEPTGVLGRYTNAAPRTSGILSRTYSTIPNILVKVLMSYKPQLYRPHSCGYGYGSQGELTETSGRYNDVLAIPWVL